MEKRPGRKAVLLVAALFTLLVVGADLAAAQTEGTEAAAASEAPAEPGPEPAAPPATASPPSVPLYMTPVWLLLFVGGVAFWVYATSWVSFDAKGVGMADRWWAGIMLGAGLGGVVLTLLIHGAVSLLLIAIVAGTAMAYIKKRNQKVPEQHRIFGAGHRASFLDKIPLLGKVTGESSGPAVALSSSQATLVNEQGQSLDDFLQEHPQLAEAAARLQDFLSRCANAHGQQASVVPYEDGYVLRVLLDGVPQNLEALDPDTARQMLSCVTAFLGLKRRAGASARLNVEFGAGSGVEVGARLRSGDASPAVVFDFPEWMPNLYQEGLEALGMHTALIKRVKSALQQERAAVVISGGPRSGKTTTLHAAVDEIDIFTHEVLWLAEEPEHDLGQVRQFPFSRDEDFKDVFPAVMREAPHVILMDDLQKPAEATLLLDFAAREGKVLCDIEAHGACTALARLAKMVDPPDTVGKSVTCVTSQVLVRRLCVQCREPFEADPESVQKLGLSGENPTLYRPVGCEACLNSGYHGRIALFSMLILTDPVRSVMREPSVTPAAIRKAAGKKAFRTLYEDGIGKVAGGITTLDEVRRVLRTKSPNRKSRKNARQ